MGSVGLYVPEFEPWYPAFRSELLSFPAGKHDDQVDALGLVGQLLDKMTSGMKPQKPVMARNDDYHLFGRRQQSAVDVLTL
jgi:hypothetical protein